MPDTDNLIGKMIQTPGGVKGVVLSYDVESGRYSVRFETGLTARVKVTMTDPTCPCNGNCDGGCK